jgi:hypothetical protein
VKPTASKVPPGWWDARIAPVSDWTADVSVPEEEPTVAAENEPVYAPDQLKPGNRKGAQRGAIAAAVVLLLYLWGNHEGNTENIWIVGIALGLIAIVVIDIILRRNGLKANDQ